VILSLDGLTLNTATRKVYDGNTKISNITPREALTLQYFMTHPNQLVRQETLLDLVSIDGENTNNSLNVLIHRIRIILDGFGMGKKLVNLRGDGWMLNSQQHSKTKMYAFPDLQLGALKSILATAAPMHKERVNMVRLAIHE
jgi:DNA-binding response OmpR family regulator